MRGLAALAAIGATFVLVTGFVPDIRIPRTVLLPTRLLPVILGVAALVSATSYALLGVPAVAVAFGIIATFIPVAAMRRGQAQRAARIRDEWPDILAQTRSGISAGATLDDAFLSALERSEGHNADSADIVRREIVFGGGLSAALEQIASASDDPTTDRVAATLRSAGKAGGPRVGEIVGVLGRSVAEEIRLRKAHDAALTEHRWTVNVALVAPWVLLGLSVATNPHAAEAFAEPSGIAVVVVGLVATGFGWVLARRTARLSEPPRVFR